MSCSETSPSSSRCSPNRTPCWAASGTASARTERSRAPRRTRISPSCSRRPAPSCWMNVDIGRDSALRAPDFRRPVRLVRVGRRRTVRRTSAPCSGPRHPSQPLQSRPHTERGEGMPLTQTQLADAVADRAGLTRADAKRALTALEDVVLEQIGDAEKVKIGSLVQLTVRLKPATKARKGRNPATGEEITIGAKPASVVVRARPLARTKAALPSVQKAKKVLG